VKDVNGVIRFAKHPTRSPSYIPPTPPPPETAGIISGGHRGGGGCNGSRGASYPVCFLVEGACAERGVRRIRSYLLVESRSLKRSSKGRNGANMQSIGSAQCYQSVSADNGLGATYGLPPVCHWSAILAGTMAVQNVPAILSCQNGSTCNLWYIPNLHDVCH